MVALRVSEILKDGIPVSRASARIPEEALRALMGDAARSKPASPTEAMELTIDFLWVEGVAPSLLDEFLTIFDSIVGPNADGKKRRLIVARGHGLRARALDNATWMLSSPCDH